MLSSPVSNNNNHKWMLIITVIVVLGSVSATITVPHLQRVLRAERERAALNSLMEIHRAETKFYASKNRFATLTELAKEGMIQKEYAGSGTIKGYNFTDSEVTANTYTIHAVREHIGYGFRDFNMTEAGDIYYVENNRAKGLIPRGQGTLFGY